MLQFEDHGLVKVGWWNSTTATCNMEPSFVNTSFTVANISIKQQTMVCWRRRELDVENRLTLRLLSAGGPDINFL